MPFAPTLNIKVGHAATSAARADWGPVQTVVRPHATPQATVALRCASCHQSLSVIVFGMEHARAHRRSQGRRAIAALAADVVVIAALLSAAGFWRHHRSAFIAMSLLAAGAVLCLTVLACYFIAKWLAKDGFEPVPTTSSEHHRLSHIRH